MVPGGEKALLKRAMKRAKLKGDPSSRRMRCGEQALCGDPIRPGGLESPFDQYRPGLRQTARATDERTLIAAIVPAGNSGRRHRHYFYRSQWDALRNGYRTILPAPAMVYIVGLMDRLVLDYVVRRKAGSHVTKSIMATIPVADVPLMRARNGR